MLNCTTDSMAVDVHSNDRCESNGAIQTENDLLLPRNATIDTLPPTVNDDLPTKAALTSHLPNKGATTEGFSNINVSTEATSGKRSPKKWSSHVTISQLRIPSEEDCFPSVSPPPSPLPLPSPTPTPRSTSPYRYDRLSKIRRDFDKLSQRVYAAFRTVESELTIPFSDVSPISVSASSGDSKDAYRTALKTYSSLISRLRDTHVEVTTRTFLCSTVQKRLEMEKMPDEADVVGLWLSCLQVWNNMLEDVLKELEDEVFLLEGGV